jgi:hypothetical protein
MTDPAHVQATAQVAVIPTPSCIAPRRAARGQAPVTATAGQGDAGAGAAGAGGAGTGGAGTGGVGAGGAGSRRAAARGVLEEALAGVRLGCRDSSFLSRLVHWDKRNAASVASLLGRARQAGRDEAALTPRQLEIVVAALDDAAIYRAAGLAGSGCWDCENIPGGRCADHARDYDRARAYAELAAVLSGTPAQPELPRPRDIAGYRHRTPVAS